MGCASSKAVHPVEELVTPDPAFSQNPSSIDSFPKDPASSTSPNATSVSSNALCSFAGSTSSASGSASSSSNNSEKSSAPVLSPTSSPMSSSSSTPASTSSSPSSSSTSSYSQLHNDQPKTKTAQVVHPTGVDDGESSQVLVLDGGAWEMKAGFAGEDGPRTVFRNIVGHMSKDDHNGTVGRRRNGLYTVRPIEQGCIVNWQAMEEIWRHTFSAAGLGIRAEEYTILLTDSIPSSSSSSSTSAHTQRDQRRKVAAVMFETFDVPGLYFSDAAVFSLFTAGRTTGVVVEAGEEATRVVPVYEGVVLPHACMTLEIGGASLTDHLMLLLTERGIYFRSAAEKEVAWDIKEKLCYVAADFAAELKAAEVSSSSSRSYEMPDGQVLTVGSERLRCAEALFQPHMVGLRASVGGVHEQVVQCVAKCDAVLHKDLYQNVVLGGGSTMFEGLAARVQRELAAIAPNVMKVKVTAPPERGRSAWIGGSILGSLSAFKDMCITKAEYNENGPVVVDRKCF